MKRFNWESVCVKQAVSGEEIAAGICFVKEHYLKAHGIGAVPPEYLFLAYIDNVIVGAFGVNTHSVPGGPRLPDIYLSGPSAIPSFIQPLNSVEFGRWISGDRRISALLIWKAIKFSLSKDKRYVWCEHGRSVHRAASMFGIKYHLISSHVIVARIEAYYSNFYLQEQPELYYFDLEQALGALTIFLKTHGYEVA